MSDRDTNALLPAATSRKTYSGLVRSLLKSSSLSRDGLKMLLTGAALSTSTSIVQYVFGMIRTLLIDTIKRLFLCTAVFNGCDDAYRWMLTFMSTHPNFQKASRFEVTSRPPFTKIDQNAIHGHYGSDHDEITLLNPQDLEGSQSVIKESRRAYYFSPADQQNLHFVHQGTHFWASRIRKEVRFGPSTEYISITYISLSGSQSIRKLLARAREQYEKTLQHKVSYYRLERHGRWEAPILKNERSADTVHLPANKKQLILEDAKTFFALETQQKYQDRHIPWRRGYLFHGPPGTGKSSLCHVLASELGLPIYEINLNNKDLDDTRFAKIMSRIPSSSIVLIEDIDAAFVKREQGESPRVDAYGRKKADSQTSFSALLNAIDGVGAEEGRLLCITTNHKNHLDPALIRSGRIDVEIEFTYATFQQAKEMYFRFYLPKGEVSEAIEAQAETFARIVEKKACTISTLQNYLLLKMDDANGALEGIEAWLCRDDEQTTQDKDEKASFQKD